MAPFKGRSIFLLVAFQRGSRRKKVAFGWSARWSSRGQDPRIAACSKDCHALSRCPSSLPSFESFAWFGLVWLFEATPCSVENVRRKAFIPQPRACLRFLRPRTELVGGNELPLDAAAAKLCYDSAQTPSRAFEGLAACICRALLGCTSRTSSVELAAP